MIGVAFYKGVHHIKVSNSKRRLADYFAKTLGVVIVAKALTRLCMGPSDPNTNSLHNRRQGNCAENFSSTWTKSHQHNQNYNQVFTLKCSKTKAFLTHKKGDFLSGQIKKIQGRFVVKPQGCVLI